MKNFLKVLLVGTVLVSATDVYSQIIPGYTSPDVERYIAGESAPLNGVTNNWEGFAARPWDAKLVVNQSNVDLTPYNITLPNGEKLTGSFDVFTQANGTTTFKSLQTGTTYVRDLNGATAAQNGWYGTYADGGGWTHYDGTYKVYSNMNSKADLSFMPDGTFQQSTALEKISSEATRVEFNNQVFVKQGDSWVLSSESLPKGANTWNTTIRDGVYQLDGSEGYLIPGTDAPLMGQVTFKNTDGGLLVTTSDGTQHFRIDNGWETTYTDNMKMVHRNGNLTLYDQNGKQIFDLPNGASEAMYNPASSQVVKAENGYTITQGDKAVNIKIDKDGSFVSRTNSDGSSASSSASANSAGSAATPANSYPPEGSWYYIGDDAYEVGANGVVYNMYDEPVGMAFESADGTDEIVFWNDQYSSVRTVRIPPKSTPKTPVEDVKKTPTAEQKAMEVKKEPAVKATPSGNLLAKKPAVQVVPNPPAKATLLHTETSAGGVITKDLTTNQITYQATPKGPKYTLDSSQAYFVDAKGNPVTVSDPEAFTALRGETVKVKSFVLSDDSGTAVLQSDGSYKVNGVGESFRVVGGNVTINGYTYPTTYTAPSTMPVKVMSIDGGTATVNFNGFDYKISADALGGATVGQAAQLSAEQVGQLGKGFGFYFDGMLSGLGDTFGNFVDSAVGTVTMPFKLVGKAWDFGKTLVKDGWDEATKGAGAFLGSMGKNFLANSTSGFTSFGQAFGVDKLAGLDTFAKTGDLTKLGPDVFGNSPESIKDFIAQQHAEATKLAKGQAVEAKNALKGLPVFVSNVAQYPIMILQTHESGNQKDTTKSVKVKAENALLASQGSSGDSTVGATLDGTNLKTAATAMAALLQNNPVDLNLLKESDLDLTKDKDQKTLRQRRDLLLQMYAVSAQVIAEGSMAISSDFYDRINALSETLTDTTGSLGAASVLNDSERYPYFEMVRQTALSAAQLGLKGAATLPNLQAMHSYHINNNK